MPKVTGTPAGSFAKKTLEMQLSGRNDGARLLHEKLSASNSKTTAMDAAKKIAHETIANLKEGFDKSVEQYMSKNQHMTTSLNTLSTLNLADKKNHQVIAGLAQDLSNKGLTSEQTAVLIRRKLWVDTLTNNPNATPKELSDAYTASLQSLHQSFTALGPHQGPDKDKLNALQEYLSPDSQAVSTSAKKGLRQVFEELQTAAEKSDFPTAMARLDSQIELLQTAKTAITKEITDLQRDLGTTTDAAKKAQIEARIAQLQKTLHNPDFDAAKAQSEQNIQQMKLDNVHAALAKLGTPTNPVQLHQSIELKKEVAQCEAELAKISAKATGVDDKIAMLEAQKAALDKQKDKNPVTSKAAQLAVEHANAYAEQSGVTPRLSAEKTAHHKEIDTVALSKVAEEYKDNPHTGPLLAKLDKSIDALNEATAKMNALLAQSVTPEARAANQVELKAASKAVDDCCKSVGQLLNDAGGDLIVQAFAEQGKLKELNAMTQDLSKLDHANAKICGSGKEGKEYIRPMASNAMSMDPEDLKKSTSKNAESMQKYYGVTHEIWNEKKGKLETVPVMGSDGKPIKLNYEEAAALVAKFNQDHPDLKPPVTIEKKAKGGYHIECHSADTKNMLIKEMKAVHDKRAAKEAQSLAEQKLDDKGAVTESATDKKEGKPGATTTADNTPPSFQVPASDGEKKTVDGTTAKKEEKADPTLSAKV